MAKITRTKLARGTKLTPDHVHGALSAAASEINAGTVEPVQLEAGSSTFRINYHIPYLGSDFPFGNNTTPAPPDHLGSGHFKFSIPFTLPPTQDFFSITSESYDIFENAPALILEEVNVSFDQRAEAAAIADHRLGNGSMDPEKGNLDFDEIRAYDLDFAILEKEQHFFSPGSLDVGFGKLVFSAPASNALFAGEVIRFNPFSVTDINASLSPFKTYAFSIAAPLLGTDTTIFPSKARQHALVSVMISLKVRSALQARDVHNGATNPIQNLPSKDSDLSVRTPASIGQTISITTPLGGDMISADAAASGVSRNMAVIDEEIRHKLKGGIDEFCETSARQVLQEDAGYEVISIPLMNNRRQGGIISKQASEEPYVSFADAIWDRSIVPIHYPMVIHSVILAWNWNRFETTAVAPHSGEGALEVPGAGGGIASDFRVHVGLGIGTGLRSDSQGYQQIAELEIFEPYVAADGLPHPVNWDSNLIDRCSVNTNQYTVGGVSHYGNGAWRPAAAGPQPKYWEWELHEVPLLLAPAPWAGTGYYATGRPFFVGKSWSPTQVTRNNVAAGAAPATAGREQFLEARMKISYGVGLPHATEEVLTGYQGHWLYVIGKKFLTR